MDTPRIARDAVWQGMPRARQSGDDVRRRGPGETATAASAARDEAAEEGQASPARVEAAQKSRNHELNEGFEVNNAGKVKP